MTHAKDYLGEIWLCRLVLQRGLAAIYVLAFANVWNQFRPLLGERGLLPVPRFLARVPFREAPSVFHLHYSDRFLAGVAGAGLFLSASALFGLPEAGPPWCSAGVWLVLFALYLSVVNVGQTFYGFGWESMLLEAGFFAAFLGPTGTEPSPIPVLLLRWMLFRVELGAGLIKLRHDECWRRLTCLFYHHETQPLPNPMSAHFHALPRWSLRGGVVFSHFVQLVVPFALFSPQPIASVAGGLTIVHQLLLIGGGNYSWLNWLTVVLGASALDDHVLGFVIPLAAPALSARGPLNEGILLVLLVLAALLSVRPALNLLSRNQLMNYSYNPLHLVNTYGAFGSVTRGRYEVILEGSVEAEDPPGGEGAWRAYEFKGKPGDPRRRPRQVAPYHLRLDWLMWFLPLRMSSRGYDVRSFVRERWFVELVRKLLEGHRGILRLLRDDPFRGRPPARIRARIYRYEFTTAEERAASGDWWKRELVGEYLRPASLADVTR